MNPVALNLPRPASRDAAAAQPPIGRVPAFISTALASPPHMQGVASLTGAAGVENRPTLFTSEVLK